ncbi:MAG: transcriptional regulator, ArsR family [Bacteroidota bacterium]|nr:transcriptional regulator, ArsR family [Bacteroidota bacterium]
MAAKDGKDALVLTREDGKSQVRFEYRKLKKIALVLKALNHPIRKQIIGLLEDKKKLSVTEIYVQLRLEQSIASQHLAILRKAEVVETDREGKSICYSINKKRMADVVVLITDLANTA